MKKKKRGRKLGSKNKDKQKVGLKYIEPVKAKLIKAIWKLQPEFKSLDINLGKYSIEQLQKHIDLVKKRRG